MGIKDLLRFMKPYIKPIHIKKYAGKRVGIDAYSWLHKGAYSCSMELSLNSNSEKKLRYLDYFMHRINLLRHYNITPVVVFDGGSIPCKATTESERHRRREANRDLAMEKLKEGNAKAASELFQRAINVTPAMAYRLIQILRAENIEFVVAPYEADAQLAYLSSLEVEKGGIVAVITEDSDLIAYGCQATVFKMDRHGNGEELVLDNVFGSETCTPSFRNFDKELFIGMCVLAGCDFLPSVSGIGIAKAYSMVSKFLNLDRVLSVLKFEKGSQVPEDYSKSFGEAVAVFQHARIYDAGTKKLKHIKPLPEKLLQSLGGELDFLGLEIPPSVATAIAEGRLDPVSMEAFNCFPTSGEHQSSIVKRTSSRLHKPEISMESKEEAGFMVFASHKAIEKESIDMLKQDLVSTETKFFKEGAALQKLLLPSEIHETIQVPDDNPLKIPDNNPFKKRKLDEMQLNQMKSNTEEVLVLSDDEESDVLRITPDITPPKVRKRCGNSLDQRESITREVSVVTGLENSDLYIAMESQESVNSKPKRISGGKERNKAAKRKTSDCKSFVNKSTSILNFFSRV
ncbi:exonuclease 1 [Melia azedarach]|uniref:Exonuclease 1 n=1 Tax=Melia azedarach TaxID=155640 RepID=A0ACC1XPW0_MELAZ|nr:exonuclease 1 [Melia azedarach]